MAKRIAWMMVVVSFVCCQSMAQSSRDPSGGSNARDDDRWRSQDQTLRRDATTRVANGPSANGRTAVPDPIEPLREIESAPRRPISRVREGIDSLPNGIGQVWREYDISPYTLRVASTNQPQTAIVDWILRETGYEAWHGDAVTILSADARTLRVYHTPEIHGQVAEIVDRFVSTDAESQAFSVRVMTVDSPNWRARVQQLLEPVPVQSQAVQAWLVTKEDAALLMAEFRKRSDFREHSSPHLLVNNGQSTVVSVTKTREYVKNVALRPEAWPGFEAQTSQIDEGFTLDLSPLVSLDTTMVDAVVKFDVDQIEKLVPVMVDVPSAAAPRQRTKIEVPQVSQCRFHERFRWPADRVLMIGLGVTAPPVPTEQVGFRFPLGPSTPRADLLLFVECKGKVVQPNSVTRTGRLDDKPTYGRY